MNESGSGPADAGEVLTSPPGTTPVRPLPSAAAQNGTLKRRNTSLEPSPFQVTKSVPTAAGTSTARVPRARSNESTTLPSLSTATRRPSGEIRGFP